LVARECVSVWVRVCVRSHAAGANSRWRVVEKVVAAGCSFMLCFWPHNCAAL